MKLSGLPAGAIDWSHVEPKTAPGKTGTALVRARRFGDIQLRLVTYSADYVADHWCDKGHIVFVTRGALSIEHEGGMRYELNAGASYHVADNEPSPHRLISAKGATVFIVD